LGEKVSQELKEPLHKALQMLLSQFWCLWFCYDKCFWN
ncbi:BCL2L13 isoform 15, partial [Pan troglodytes]